MRTNESHTIAYAVASASSLRTMRRPRIIARALFAVTIVARTLPSACSANTNGVIPVGTLDERQHDVDDRHVAARRIERGHATQERRVEVFAFDDLGHLFGGGAEPFVVDADHLG